MIKNIKKNIISFVSVILLTFRALLIRTTNYIKNNKKQIISLISITLLIFAVFFFTSLGAYTRRDILHGLQTSSVFGERFFAGGTTNWFIPLNNIILVLFLLTPFIYLGFQKAIKGNKKNYEQKLNFFVFCYFSIFVFTIFVFALESISLIALFQQYFKADIMINFTKLGTLSDYSFSLVNKATLNEIFALIYLVGIILIFFIFIFLFFINKKMKNANDYLKVWKMSGITLLGTSMFLLMMAAFGAGTLGINTGTYKYSITTNDVTYNSVQSWFIELPRTTQAFILSKLPSGFSINNLGAKNLFWGVNNNWSGYSIYVFLFFGMFYSIWTFISKTLSVKNGTFKYDKKENAFFRGFLSLTIICFLFYFFDRYIIVFVDNGNWNPNLFNGKIYKTIFYDYHGTTYFWIMFVLLPLTTVSSFIVSYKRFNKDFTRKNFYYFEIFLAYLSRKINREK